MQVDWRRYPKRVRFCGKRRPGTALDRPYEIDYSMRETTPDQSRIEAVLDSMNLSGAHILHVGVGNSRLARRFAPRVARIDGLTVSAKEKQQAESLGLPNYRVYLMNKYSAAYASVIQDSYDVIVDNNLASFVCCVRHFRQMWTNYLFSLKPRGRILTDRAGMDFAFAGPHWKLTYGDLARLERRLPLKASQLTTMVYSLERIER